MNYHSRQREKYSSWLYVTLGLVECKIYNDQQNFVSQDSCSPLVIKTIKVLEL